MRGLYVILEPRDILVEVTPKAPLGVLMQFARANHFYYPYEIAIFLGLSEKLPEAFLGVAQVKISPS